MEELQLKSLVIECKFNVISVLVDGFDILIENDQAGDFIDVLIRSGKSRRTIWNYMEKYIVEELRNFCASSQGCPRVELAMHIIRTKCVKRLTPCKHRRNQSVSREDLKKNLMSSVQKLDARSEVKDLYFQTWIGVPEAQLEAGCEEALELLPPEDVDETFAWIKAYTQSLQAKVIIVRDVITEIDGDRQELSLADRGVQSSNFSETLRFGRSRSEQWVNRSYESRFENILRGIHRDVKTVGGDVKEVLAVVRDLKREIQDVTQMHHKLDQLLGYSVSPMQWPKRPFFTQKDTTIFHRITAVVDIGKSLMLHFKCEERDGHHIVPKQPGYGITVVKQNCEALRQISRNSVQVIWYLLKAGLHITTGMGDLVPELQTSDGNTTLLTSLPMASLLYRLQPRDGRSSKQITNPCSPEEAWRYLQDFLESNLKSRITELFLLHRAQYFDRDSTSAWLCQECLKKGFNRNKLKKL